MSATSDDGIYGALAPRPPAPQPIPFANGSLAVIVERIIEAVDEETASLRAGARFDIPASNARKSRHLYDLNRALKAVSPALLGPDDRARVVRMRAQLAANEMAIRAHIAAVGEIAALVQSAILRFETDGTYSAHAARSRPG